MKKKIELNNNIIKTIEDELVEGLGLRAVKCQYIELDEISVIHFVFKYLSLQDNDDWKKATYAIGMIEEE